MWRPLWVREVRERWWLPEGAPRVFLLLVGSGFNRAGFRGCMVWCFGGLAGVGGRTVCGAFSVVCALRGFPPPCVGYAAWRWLILGELFHWSSCRLTCHGFDSNSFGAGIHALGARAKALVGVLLPPCWRRSA